MGDKKRNGMGVSRTVGKSESVSVAMIASLIFPPLEGYLSILKFWIYSMSSSSFPILGGAEVFCRKRHLVCVTIAAAAEGIFLKGFEK